MATKISPMLKPHRFIDADYRSMVETIEDYAIFFLDASGYIQTWNAGAHRLNGYTADEIIGQHFSIFYPAEMVEKRWPDYELMMAREHGRFEVEDWRLRKDGTRFWASVILTRLNDEEGNLRGFSKITRDVTVRRQHEEALRSSEERFRFLVEGVHDYAIFMLDPGGYIISWNSGARLSTGYSSEEILGKHFSIFYPREAIAKDWPQYELQKAIAEGRYEEEGWRLRKDGTQYWASVVITALKDAAGNHRGFAKVTRDLTEKRRVAILENEGKRITAFIAMLAHELRNPLAPIANAVELLRAERMPSSTLELARNIIARQQKQLSRLVEDLLDINRITSGSIHLEKKPLNLHEAVHEAIEAIDPLCREKNQTLESFLTNESVWICGDRARVIQIVSNLLHNAMKYTPTHGHITVTTECENNNATVRVKDNGSGIEPSRLPQLFMRFEQRTDDETKTHGGLGLGLSLVHQLTTLQGGHVFANSAGIAGQGSEFCVQFETIDAPLINAQPHAQATKAILIADDNRDAADSLALMLELKGYTTLVAYCGNDAIEIIKSAQPHVAILDIGLPDIDGIEVVQKLTMESTHLPTFIAMTGYGMESDRERSFKAGFHAHLTKPVEPSYVYELVKSISKE